MSSSNAILDRLNWTDIGSQLDVEGVAVVDLNTIKRVDLGALSEAGGRSIRLIQTPYTHNIRHFSN